MRTTLTLLLSFFCCLGFSQSESFSYDKFKNAQGLILSSDAKEAKGKVQLTPAQSNRRGGLWFSKQKMSVSDTFQTTFCFKIHKNGGIGSSGDGGEGIAFVIHNNEITAKNGRKQEGMGYSGIENSVAIEFDTQDTEDMGEQHVSVQTNGLLANSYNKSCSYAAMKLDGFNLKDGKEHTAKIHYNNPFLTISLDGFEVLKCEIDLTEYINLDEGCAWVGLTSATGKAYSIHEVSCFSMTSQTKQIPYEMEVKAEGRAMKRTKRVVVHSKKIRIRLWDINQEDGDIVSVNLNGKWVIDHFQLTNAGKYFEFELVGQANYLVLHAHNLGEIPPNTAGISVSDGIGGEKEYTLRSNLYESDALLIEYHKKKENQKDLEVTRKSGKGKPDMKVE